jgi:hypothetical protein
MLLSKVGGLDVSHIKPNLGKSGPCVRGRRGGLADKALREAAEAFGKEIAPLGQKAGALTHRITEWYPQCRSC